jgi:hypothetical protein
MHKTQKSQYCDFNLHYGAESTHMNSFDTNSYDIIKNGDGKYEYFSNR